MVFAPGIYIAQTMPELRTATTFSPPDIFDCRMTAGDTRCPEFNCTPGIKNTYYRLPSQQCFTIDVNAMQKDDPLFKDCPQQAKWELELRYRWSKESTMLLLPAWSYPIFVHQTGHCPPDKLPAVVLLPGKVIQVTVKQLRTIRLPSPYKSMCTDYKSMGSFPEFKGFLNHDLCMQKCSMELEVRHCGCVLADYEFTASYPAPTCDFGPTDTCYNALMGNGSYDECKRSCTLPCEQVHYDVRMSSISDDEGPYRQTFKLKLKYRSDVEDLVIYHPTLTIIELAAYTGAYLGIWLGTSVVTFLLDLHTKAMQHKWVSYSTCRLHPK
ncbi:amiloride-sensitive sodium channel subunit alpha [Ixodes scapularis]|uniref:amiloride-sensitive sodium channel subunit alpha n=1 Tax=Ixodes scapularis TaxID=6945 RepID=UPI001C388124|nr:amiloride-sensitive sodium channel subunit alpha [Ixodes scapularis]